MGYLRKMRENQERKKISPILALIYNESLAQGNVPDDWRHVNVSPVFKKGEK